MANDTTPTELHAKPSPPKPSLTELIDSRIQRNRDLNLEADRLETILEMMALIRRRYTDSCDVPAVMLCGFTLEQFFQGELRDHQAFMAREGVGRMEREKS